VRLVWEHEAERPNDVRGRSEEYFAFGERFAHQCEFELLKITEAAMDQLGRRTRGMRGKVIPLAKPHRKPTPDGIAGDAHAVHTTTNHQDIDLLDHHTLRWAGGESMACTG
jgi:hypothetical protein